MLRLNFGVFITIILVVSLQGFRARSAEFTVLFEPSSGHPMVLMSGPIQRGDADRFFDSIQKFPSATVVLSGPGGSVKEALEIGSEIRYRGFATSVLPDEVCVSACGLIWLSGDRRYMSQQSVIGFHAAYIVRDGVPQETGMGNAEIGSFMTHLGYGIEAFRFLTAAPPNGMNRLTLGSARALGMDVYENRGFDVITPEDHPSIRRLARQASYTSAAIQLCGVFFSEAEKGALMVIVEDIFSRGHAEFGSDEFLKAVLRDRDQLEFDSRDQGFNWCIETAVSVVVDQLIDSSILLGPSFDCNLAATDTEWAICSDKRVGRLDALLAETYVTWINKGGPRAGLLKSSQSDWRKSRNRCGANLNCLAVSYEKRSKEILAWGY